MIKKFIYILILIFNLKMFKHLNYLKITKKIFNS